MKKLKGSLLTICLALVAITTIAFAGTFLLQPGRSTMASAASESDLTFTLQSDGTYSVKAAKIDSLAGAQVKGDLIIPAIYNGKPVTVIEDRAFYQARFLTSVTIPNSIKRIGYSAFNKCGIKSLTIPNSVTYIGNGAFENTPITSITIPNSVTYVGNSAFNNCYKLTDITIPDSVTYVGFDVVWQTPYYNNTDNWENGVLYIGKHIIKANKSVISGDYEVKEGTLTIANSAFYGCSNITSVTIPNSIVSIQDDAFQNCSKLKEIIFKGTREQWDAVIKGSGAIPDSVNVVCLGDKIEISADIENYGTTKGNVTVTYSGYAVDGYFSVSGSGFTSESVNAFTSGTTFTEEGFYRIEARNGYVDAAVLCFYIDRTAPTGTLTGVEDCDVTSKTVRFSWTESNATAMLNGASYVSNKSITAEGVYTLILTDAAGNSTTYSFTIDKTAPVISDYKNYTNTEFTLTATDEYCDVAYWEYRLNDGAVIRHDGEELALGSDTLSNGVWMARVTDAVGNTSNWVTVNYVRRDTFGNYDSFRNSFFVPSYYVVTLSQKNYNNCYGDYSFAEYSSALKFATQKEWECRVIELDGGSSWNYVTATNENIRQIYSDKAELNAVIDKYARKNISDRKVIGHNSTELSNPTDADGITRADALTVQLTELPSVLSGYSNYRFMLASLKSSPTMPRSVVEGNKATATIQYISDGISLRVGPKMTLEYGVPLKNAVQEQGWYLITERDICGNEEKYLIFIDLQQPEISAAVTSGKDETEIITFNQAYIEENAGAMRFMSFAFDSLTDNIDDFVMLSINGRNLESQFVWGDELPVLSYSNGYYGAYTIKAYDRSHNFVEFMVYIAGAAPTLKNSSLTNETSCTFTVQINDNHNEITDIKMFKVFYDGSEEQLFVDSYGTVVTAANLIYKMNVGGKYAFEFTDLYGRTIQTEPIFYMKGLPTATLRGVKEGGLTKNDVSVIYDKDVTAELYVYRGGEWLVTDLYSISEGTSSNSLNILAGADTTAIYKVFLYVTADRNLFTEYTFEIDGILPIVDILTTKGNTVIPGNVTMENFYLTWNESGYTAYYRKQGAISDNRYTKDMPITTAGTYVFTIYDLARNELAFTVTLDNTVSYTLVGIYTLLDDGSYITHNSFTFTLTEPWSEFSVDASNGIAVSNGQKLDADGTYKISAKDMYGNSMTLTLIIDKLPPMPSILTVDNELLNNGARTTKAFKATCAESNVLITYSFANGNYIVYDGGVLNDAGIYEFKFTDRVGNTANVTITIDRTLQYRLDGKYILKDEVLYSRTWVQFVAMEELATFTIENGNGDLLDITKRIDIEGSYTVTLTDLAGNSEQLSVIIDKTAPTLRIMDELGNELYENTVSKSFKVVCDEPDANITYTFNNSASIKYDGGLLSENGIYVFTVTDFLGTFAERRVEIDLKVALEINGAYVIDEDGNYISKSWLSVTLLEDMKVFNISSSSGVEFGADTRIYTEGIYTLYAKDMSGNTIEMNLIIDKTAPVIELVGVDVNGTTGSDVKLRFIDCNNAYYRLNGGEVLPITNNMLLSDEGNYNVVAQDLVGNTTKVMFSIDKHVDVIPGISLVEGQFITGNISFKFNEPVETVLVLDGTEIEYSRGVISMPGTYVLTVSDDYGNVKTFRWSILPAKAKGYELNVADGYTVSVFKDDIEIDNVVGADIIELTNNGKYVLKFNRTNENWMLMLEVDTVAPTVQFEKAMRSIKISNPSKEGITYTLYKDGELTSFKLNKVTEIKKTGSYRLICTDEIGNVTEYVFELHYLSDASIALIVIVSALTIAGIVTLLTFRFKRKRF